MRDAPGPYTDLLRLLDTRSAGRAFPDLLTHAAGGDRLAELGLERADGDALREVRALRDALARVVLGDADVRTRVTGLNRLTRRYTLVPQLDATLAVRHTSARTGPVGRLVCRVLPQAMDLVRTGDVDRVGVCASVDCAAPFVATGARTPRSYCSPRCAGRERLRRFRAGHR